MSEPANGTAIEGQKPRQTNKPMNPALRSLIWLLAERAAEESMLPAGQSLTKNETEAASLPAPRARRGRKP